MKKLVTLCSAYALLAAFDNGTPGWKLDADGKIEMKDGNPIFVNSAGQEQTVGGDTISTLRQEAMTHRQAKEAAETKLAAFKDIDPVKAKEALEAVKKIDLNKLVESGKLDEVRNELTKQFNTQLGEKDTALNDLQGRMNNMLVSDVFKSSSIVREGIAVPPDMFEATFRNNFKVEEGKIVAYGKDGNRLLSKARAGEYADPEEALQLLVEAHPQKDQIMKATVGNGSGNQGGGGGRGVGRTMKRSDFEKQTPMQQAEISSKVRSGEMQLTD